MVALTIDGRQLQVTGNHKFLKRIDLRGNKVSPAVQLPIASAQQIAIISLVVNKVTDGCLGRPISKLRTSHCGYSEEQCPSDNVGGGKFQS